MWIFCSHFALVTLKPKGGGDSSSSREDPLPTPTNTKSLSFSAYFSEVPFFISMKKSQKF
jgi:hypothetical protein